MPVVAAPAARHQLKASALPRPTLVALFDPRSNAMNFIRLLLAATVIIGHAAVVGGYPLPGWASLIAGNAAVDPFFALSGFLVARAWDRRPNWRRFLWHRSLRILPAFWACLAMTALVIAPLATLAQRATLDGYWVWQDGPASYVYRNAALFMRQYGISGGPADVAFPQSWDGSLWSLYWEFLCYLGLGVLGVVGWVQRRRGVILAIFGLTWAIQLERAFLPDVGARYFDTARMDAMCRVSFMFLAGVVLYLFADRIPANKRLAGAGAIVVLFSAAWVDPYLATGGLALTYVMVYVGCVLPVRVGMRHDISYGMYIYGMPMQQTLAMAGLAGGGLAVFSAVSLLATIPLAWASWLLVERPALRLKNWSPRRAAPVVDGDAPAAAQGGLDPALAVERIDSDGSRRQVLLGRVVMPLLFLAVAAMLLPGWIVP